MFLILKKRRSKEEVLKRFSIKSSGQDFRTLNQKQVQTGLTGNSPVSLRDGAESCHAKEEKKYPRKKLAHGKNWRGMGGD